MLGTSGFSIKNLFLVSSIVMSSLSDNMSIIRCSWAEESFFLRPVDVFLCILCSFLNTCTNKKYYSHNKWLIIWQIHSETWFTKTILGQYELFTYRNTRYHLEWSIGNRGPMYEECIPHRVPHAWEQQWWNKRKKQIQGSQQKSIKKSGRKECGHEDEKPQTRPN